MKACVRPPQRARLIPMPECRPHYPHLTIWPNQIYVGLFVGVHCRQANLTLKIVRGGTACYTMALCAQTGPEDAMLSFQDITAHTIDRLAETVRNLHRAGGRRSGRWRQMTEQRPEDTPRHVKRAWCQPLPPFCLRNIKLDFPLIG